MFIDEAKIFVRSGTGGDGFVHFHTEKYVNRGGPDGGDGGRGGDLILRANKKLNTLSTFRHISRYGAKDGKKGHVNNSTGRSAEHLIINVPTGTIIYDDLSGMLLGDLVSDAQELTICKGGRGGRGNTHFVSAGNQAPRTGEKGEPGEEKWIKLELKLIADIGIVGVPNAGKSSFLASVTNATPKIANYPFTTLEPNLGVAELDLDTTLILADIPGLIEGAHQGIGLGDSFLRHIQRTKVILHLLDGLSDDPIADFDQINQEMALFDENLSQKPQIVVLNKLDLPEVQEKWEGVRTELQKRGCEVMAISAAAQIDVRPVLWKLHNLLKNVPEPEVKENLPLYTPAEDPRIFNVERDSSGDGWMVRGKAIERAAKMTFWEHPGSVRRFQKLLTVLGIEDALRKAGAENGDTVMIGDYFELEWID